MFVSVCFLSQCGARAPTLIGNRFVKELCRRSSEDANYTGAGISGQALQRGYFGGKRHCLGRKGNFVERKTGVQSANRFARIFNFHEKGK